MATSFGASTAFLTNTGRKSPLCHRNSFGLSNSNKVTFRIAPKPKLRFSFKGMRSGWNSSAVVRARLNEVPVDESSKAAASTPIKSEASPAEATLASEESLSEFITQVTNLVKLVDSKDIVELQLKQLDCELLIRKKEALTPPPSPPPTYVQAQPQYAAPPPAPAPSPVPTAAPSSTPAPAPVAPKALPSKSSHPPLKSPMAGTFYRSPAPGEPAFVKVGDKVKKGQVLCIIEAMKLMNEIEADQTGTIVEIVAEDAKPVSVDTPLFVIEP